MKKRIQTVTISLFLIFIFGFALANVFSEDREFSMNENRFLAKMPEVSFNNIFNANFDEEFDTYFNDQFVFRDQWIMLKSLYQQLTFNIANNGVYYGQEQHLLAQTLSYNQALLDKNIQYVNEFAQAHEKVNFMLIPTASAIDKALLPSFSYNIDQKALIDHAYDQVKANNIDLYDRLSQEDDQLYFKTDHHWNEKGAMIAYEAICDQVLAKQPNEFSYTLMAEGFKGTLLSKAGTFWYEGDDIYRIDPQQPIDISMTIDQQSTIYDSLYMDDALQQKDKYTYYEGGNHAIVEIKTGNANGKKAVVIKDSYAHILMPYLVSEYEEIIMVDLRYFKTEVSPYIEEDTDVYIIYSVDTFISDNNLVFLK
ncbi:MAG: DHHW family protein [Erysipelotrichaceae bacterium]|nr:DHHW family protein [Erysipelotrichaceae bacterium]MDY5251654.1 DHHW family protein [Erysipelotrichaceae bacterium]